MSGTGTGRSRGLAVLQQLTKALTEWEDSPGALYTKVEAARRLRVSPRRLRQMLFLGQLTRVKVFRRELVFLG